MSPRQRLAIAVVLAFAGGVSITDIVRDYRESVRWEEVARERVFWAAPETCTATMPGERAVQTNNGRRIDCVVYENTGYGRAPRPVRALTFPALDHPLEVAQ
ncbi:MAG: hypothetical protein Q7U97_05590 [Rhodocyclaceae bacterium]|nr:hypothetical protein [Rhodocyclaceae bacterium]